MKVVEQNKIFTCTLLMTAWIILSGATTNYPNQQSQFVCENKNLALSCSQAEEALHIIEAHYGNWRNKEKRCCSTWFWENPCERCTKQHDTKVLKKVKLKCEGKRGCNVPANNAMFGDTCKGVTKYLEVKYTCVQNSSVKPTLREKKTTSTTRIPTEIHSAEFSAVSSHTPTTSNHSPSLVNSPVPTLVTTKLLQSSTTTLGRGGVSHHIETTENSVLRRTSSSELKIFNSTFNTTTKTDNKTLFIAGVTNQNGHSKFQDTTTSTYGSEELIANEHTGKNTGLVGGIGGGVGALVVLVLIGVGFTFFLRKRRRHHDKLRRETESKQICYSSNPTYSTAGDIFNVIHTTNFESYNDQQHGLDGLENKDFVTDKAKPKSENASENISGNGSNPADLYSIPNKPKFQKPTFHRDDNESLTPMTTSLERVNGPNESSDLYTVPDKDKNKTTSIDTEAQRVTPMTRSTERVNGPIEPSDQYTVPNTGKLNNRGLDLNTGKSSSNVDMLDNDIYPDESSDVKMVDNDIYSNDYKLEVVTVNEQGSDGNTNVGDEIVMFENDLYADF